jgi:hypothetical protein
MAYLDDYERALFAGITTQTREEYEAPYLARLRIEKEQNRRAREERRRLKELELMCEKEYFDSLSPNPEFARWLKYTFRVKKKL